MNKSFLLTCLLNIAYLVPSFAQTGGFLFNYMGMGASTAMATDYQSIGINPANLGFDNDYTLSLEIGVGSQSLYSEALAKDELKYFNAFGSELTEEQQQEVATALLEDGYQLNVRIKPVGMGISLGNAGAIGISWTIAADQSFALGSSASNLFFEGFDFEGYFDTIIADDPENVYAVAYDPVSLSGLTEGTNLYFSLQSALNLSWGRKWMDTENFDLYGGLGLSYVMSYAYFEFKSDGNDITGNTALGLDLFNTSAYLNTFDGNQHPGKPVGKGLGVDIGLTADIGEHLTIGAAVVNIGKVNYTLNALQFNDVVVDTVYFSGIESTKPLDILSTIMEQSDLIAFEGVSSFSIPLPTTLRLGAAYTLSDMLTLAADLTMPVSETANNFTNAQFGAGAKFTLLRVLNLSAGITAGGKYGLNIPAGIGLDFGFWELGVATRDITILLGENKPTVSYAMGLLRFKF